MQLTTLTVSLALSAGALAQLSIPTDPVGISIFSVLATAIPQSVQLSAFQNPSSFGAEIASSISAGNPPPWYTALPNDIKSILPSLYPAAAPATTTGGGSASSGASTTPAPTASSSVSGSPTARNGTTVVTTGTLRSASTGAGSSPSTSKSGNGAAAPTAVIGAGVAGALGLLGMLVL